MPWKIIEDENQLAEELYAEITNDHPLFDISVKVKARRQDCDDFLFELLDGSGRHVVVHLTWQKEVDPIWPHTELYSSIDEFFIRRHNPDVDEWELMNKTES